MKVELSKKPLLKCLSEVEVQKALKVIYLGFVSLKYTEAAFALSLFSYPFIELSLDGVNYFKIKGTGKC